MDAELVQIASGGKVSEEEAQFVFTYGDVDGDGKLSVAELQLGTAVWYCDIPLEPPVSPSACAVYSRSDVHTCR